jgi:RNA-directed DNA polymerase
MQALYALALDPIAETEADPNSYGFRRERSPVDAIEQCFGVLARQTSAQWVLEGDIQACFDALGHEWLLESRVRRARPLARNGKRDAARRNHLTYPGEYGARRTGSGTATAVRPDAERAQPE